MEKSKYASFEDMEARLVAKFGEPSDQVKVEVDKWIQQERIEIELSATLADIRSASSLTQQELSAKTGIPQSEISRMMKHGANPKFKTLCKIVAAMGGKVEITWPAPKS